MPINRCSRRQGLLPQVAVLSLALLVLQTGCSKSKSNTGSGWRHAAGKAIELPAPKTDSGMTLTQALATRRSHREFAEIELTPAQVSQLCWAAQGVTNDSGNRTAPSAGGLYPLTIVMADTRGVFEYRPDTHALIPRGDQDVRAQLQKAGLNQSPIGEAPACFIVTMDVSITAKKYGKDAERYCLMEAGHAAQNLLLTATALKLGAVSIGALYEDNVSKALGLPSRLRPVYLIPVGHSR